METRIYTRANVPHGQFFNLSLTVYGIKKRCRKEERHKLKLGYIAFQLLTPELQKYLTDIALAKVAETMRANLFPLELILWRVNIDPVSETQQIPDPLSLSFRIYDPSTKSEN